MSRQIENYVPVVLADGLNTNKAAALGSTLAVTGATTLSSTLAVTGAITATGGVVQAASDTNFWGDSGHPQSLTAGTNTTGIANTVWLTQAFIPAKTTITGLGFLVGGTGGTDKCVLSIYSSTGALLGNTTVAGGGTTVGTASTYQTIDLATPVVVTGPTYVFLGVNTNGTTAKIQTDLNTGSKYFGGNAAQTTATPANIAPPNSWTVSTAPFMFTY